MPMIVGAAAVEATFSPTALALFGMVYFWQFPHTMAIDWLYRDQFAAAGIKVAPVVDPTGRTAGVLAVLGAVLLLPVMAVPALVEPSGWPYVGYGALHCSSALHTLVCAVRFARRRNTQTARRLLRVSLIYLPLVLLARADRVGVLRGRLHPDKMCEAQRKRGTRRNRKPWTTSNCERSAVVDRFPDRATSATDGLLDSPRPAVGSVPRSGDRGTTPCLLESRKAI